MPSDDTKDREHSQIAKFEKQTLFPQDLKLRAEEWARNREYVHTTTGDQGLSTDTSTTNYILRAVQAAVRASRLNDPVVRLQAGDYLPEQDNPDPAIQQQALADGNPFNRYPIGWTTYLKTQEILVGKQIKKGGLVDAINEMNFERRFSAVSWLKVRWIEDDGSDPLGQPLPTKQAKLRRYQSLYEQNEEQEFVEEDPEYDELLRLSEDLKAASIRQIRESLTVQPPESPVDSFGQPLPGEQDPRLDEILRLQGEGLYELDPLEMAPTYQGYSFEIIEPEDVRFDWSVSRPCDMRRARWIAHRHPMFEADIRETWGLTEEEYAENHSPRTDNSKTGDQDGTDSDKKALDDIEASAVGKKPYVWEYWDLVARKRYRWVQGGRGFLDVIDIDRVPSRLHPFFPLFGNAVSGTIFGPTDVEMGRPIQERINLLATHDLQARQASYPKWIYEKGLFSEEDAASIEVAQPFSNTPTNRRIDDIKKGFMEYGSVIYNPIATNPAAAIAALEINMGISASRMGTTSSADLATTEAIANQGFGDRVQDDRQALLDLFEGVVQYMVQMNALRMDSQNVVAQVGPGAHWPVEQMEHDQILNNFMVKISAAPSDAQERRQKLQDLTQLAPVMQSLGLPVARTWFVKELAEALGRSAELESMIDVAALLEPPPAQGVQDTGSVRKDPEDQGERGDEGGRPQMREQQPPITPDTVPNNQSPNGQ